MLFVSPRECEHCTKSLFEHLPDRIFHKPEPGKDFMVIPTEVRRVPDRAIDERVSEWHTGTEDTPGFPAERGLPLQGLHL